MCTQNATQTNQCLICVAFCRYSSACCLCCCCYCSFVGFVNCVYCLKCKFRLTPTTQIPMCALHYLLQRTRKKHQISGSDTAMHFVYKHTHARIHISHTLHGRPIHSVQRRVSIAYGKGLVTYTLE